MKFEHNGAIHEVIYIEYIGRRVHSVITTSYIEKATNGPYWRCYSWDFEKDCRGFERFMHYNSGSGGTPNEIQAPSFIKKASAMYWISDKAKFRGKPKNAVQKMHPMKIKNDPNPFNNSRLIYAIEYCQKCNKHYDESYCPKHGPLE